MRWTPLALGLALLLAGCTTPTTDDDVLDQAQLCPSSPYDQEGVLLAEPTFDPISDDKDNATEFATTNVRTCTLPAIGWTALRQDGVPHKYLGEMDMRGDLDLGAVAVVGSGEPGGVYVLDIADRAAPKVLSFIPQPGLHVTDVKISDDGKILYTASQALATAGVADPMAPASPAGFTAYSLTDPKAPQHLGAVFDTQVGCHMLEPVQVAANQDAVFCISQHVRSYLIQRDGPFILNLGFVEYVPTRGGLPMPSAVPAVGDPSCDLPEPATCVAGTLFSSGPHDVTVTHENGTFGAGSYAVVSHWDEGLKVLDISQAPLITEVGAWNGEGATHYDGNVHTAMMFRAAGHRYIMASPEYTAGTTVPSLWVLDADDLGNLQLVAEWFHPGLHGSQGLYLTTHQWQVAPRGDDVSVEDVRVYLTYNHAGVWVLDFGQILAGDNAQAVLGYNLARTPIPDDHVPNAVLNTWDVNVVDGHVYGTDRATGLWVFGYTGDALGDPALTGFA
ncbi:MAG: hypothetical protein QOD77_828 [Thermoplasmata archaeon]|jgi:hypothetical protein|nr:hypothetical protein [Thermoplasmata archaeon]